MAEKNLKIMQVSTTDLGGGAEIVACTLHKAYEKLGHESSIAVGVKRSADPHIYEIQNLKHSDFRKRVLHRVANVFEKSAGKIRGADFLRRQILKASDPKAEEVKRQGLDNFNYPGTKKLFNLTDEKPDILHLHNLHGNYFDLRELAKISQKVPVVVTLHDAWLFSGHCVHAFDCQRWKKGCGQCPDLNIPLKVERDATAENWKAKYEIYKKSKIYLTTPCQWLMGKAKESMLWQSVVDSKVIHNGVNLTIFQPADKNKARAKLGISLEKKIILFVANGIRKNPHKDYTALRKVIENLSHAPNAEQMHFIGLGEDAESEKIGELHIEFIAHQRDPKIVANYYQAADIYLHLAKADTFPNTILEALSCGTPVVGSKVCGIPEQIIDLKNEHVSTSSNATGILVENKNIKDVARAILLLINDDKLRGRISKNAAKQAKQDFDQNKQISAHLNWYEDILMEKMLHSNPIYNPHGTCSSKNKTHP